MLNVSFGSDGDCPLIGRQILSSVDSSSFFHGLRGMRAPLGIYNASIARVCPRVSRYCNVIEPLFREIRIDPKSEGPASRAKVADALEAMLYAAAEHVDDIENLASGFFRTHPLAKMDSRYRELANRIDKCKKVTSTIANKIKHEQARVRLYALEILHVGIPTTLHGFIIEGVNDGTVGPHRAVHSTHPVLSLTTIAWEVLEFVAAVSMALARFLASFPKVNAEQQKLQCTLFADATKAAARLPTYTFGEPHPFSRTSFRLSGEESCDGAPDSDIYGSIQRRWIQSSAMEFGGFAMTTEGDGVSKSFAMVNPTNVTLVHWQ